MSQNETLWAFCNSETSFQSEEMTFENAINFAKNIPSAQREFWFAWQTGWEDWKAVLDVEQFKDHVRSVAKPPPLPPRRHQPAPEPQPKSERRRHPRHEIRFRIIIRSEELTFRTFTKDISLGGLSLENPIPERLLDQKCQVFIGDLDSNESIRFTLQPTERRDRRYFSFSGIEEAMLGKLNQWINAQVSKSDKKRAG